MEEALEALGAFLASPSVRLLLPGDQFASVLLQCLREGDARGNIAFDAQIAAVCREQGIDRLLTEDRDFARFSRLQTVPLSSPIE
jgi:predicted nucleic acid-binding protein